MTNRPSALRVACLAARTAAVSAAVLCAAACGGGGEGDLWGDSMTPTQMQNAEWRSNVQPYPMATTQGDSDDPFIDNPNYPFVEEPWWQNPAYSGG
jgi:hypothetical protein